MSLPPQERAKTGHSEKTAPQYVPLCRVALGGARRLKRYGRKGVISTCANNKGLQQLNFLLSPFNLTVINRRPLQVNGVSLFGLLK